jgi:hypothetical protein
MGSDRPNLPAWSGVERHGAAPIGTMQIQCADRLGDLFPAFKSRPSAKRAPEVGQIVIAIEPGALWGARQPPRQPWDSKHTFAGAPFPLPSISQEFK